MKPTQCVRVINILMKRRIVGITVKAISISVISLSNIVQTQFILLHSGELFAEVKLMGGGVINHHCNHDNNNLLPHTKLFTKNWRE